MKNFMFYFFLVSSTLAFAQEDIDVKGNSVSVKERAPVWPGCENEVDKKECFNQKLMEHVRKNYQYPRNAEGQLIRGKVVVKLEINEKGEAVVTSVKGNQKSVNAAAETMIKTVPVMKPGTRAGKPTSISYTIPLTL